MPDNADEIPVFTVYISVTQEHISAGEPKLSL